MATQKQVTEPAKAPADQTAEPARAYDPNKSVKVYDKNTGELLRRTVPETWLDGRFPNLKAAPSNKKEGK